MEDLKTGDNKIGLDLIDFSDWDIDDEELECHYNDYSEENEEEFDIKFRYNNDSLVKEFISTLSDYSEGFFTVKKLSKHSYRLDYDFNEYGPMYAQRQLISVLKKNLNKFKIFNGFESAYNKVFLHAYRFIKEKEKFYAYMLHDCTIQDMENFLKILNACRYVSNFEDMLVLFNWYKVLIVRKNLFPYGKSVSILFKPVNYDENLVVSNIDMDLKQQILNSKEDKETVLIKTLNEYFWDICNEVFNLNKIANTKKYLNISGLIKDLVNLIKILKDLKKLDFVYFTELNKIIVNTLKNEYFADFEPERVYSFDIDWDKVYMSQNAFSEFDRQFDLQSSNYILSGCAEDKLNNIEHSDAIMILNINKYLEFLYVISNPDDYNTGKLISYVYNNIEEITAMFSIFRNQILDVVIMSNPEMKDYMEYLYYFNNSSYYGLDYNLKNIETIINISQAKPLEEKDFLVEFKDFLSSLYGVLTDRHTFVERDLNVDEYRDYLEQLYDIYHKYNTPVVPGITDIRANKLNI